MSFTSAHEHHNLTSALPSAHKAGHVVLKQSVQSQLGLFVDTNLVRVRHEPRAKGGCQYSKVTKCQKVSDLRIRHIKSLWVHMPSRISEHHTTSLVKLCDFLHKARVSALIVALNIITWLLQSHLMRADHKTNSTNAKRLSRLVDLLLSWANP